MRLIAGWLSSNITVGAFCGNPMSAANWRKYRMCWAQRPKARYLASQGLKAIAEASDEEWVTNGGVLLPIRMR